MFRSKLSTAAVTPTCDRNTAKPMKEKGVPELLSPPPPAERGQRGGVSPPHRGDESGPRPLLDLLWDVGGRVEALSELASLVSSLARVGSIIPVSFISARVKALKLYCP